MNKLPEIEKIMDVGSKSGRFNSMLDHDLSPMPLLTVILGYWLPLDWILRGWTLFSNATLDNISLLEKFQAVGSSVVLNFLPTALVLALIVYLSCSFPIMRQSTYSLSIRWGMNFVANLVALATTAIAIKRIVMGAVNSPPPVKAIALIVVPILALWLTVRNFSIARLMIVPRWLALALLPMGLGLVGHEILSQPRALPRIVAASSQIPAVMPPDIILVTLDACASRHLSCYGYHRLTSPRLDAFSRNALLFEQFYANSNWTRPGIASLLNGTRPWSHEADIGRPSRKVTEGQNLLGCLARAGYDIRTVSLNAYADHAWQRTPIAPTEQAALRPIGGQPICPHLVPSLVYSNLLGPAGKIDWLLNLLSKHQIWGTSRVIDQASPTLALSKAKDLLGRAPTDRPTFFWVHFFLPHDPYAAPDSNLGHFESSPFARSPETSGGDFLFTARENSERQLILEGRYDESLLSVDGTIGELLDWLKAHDRLDKSLVVVSADHGESFTHGYGGHGGPLLTEDLIRVPLLLKPPGHRGAERVSQLFEQADLAPTVLHMAGLPVPQGMEGRPYPVKPDGLPVFAMNRDLSTSNHTFSLAMRQGNWKYVDHFGRWNKPWPKRELYDLAMDPKENLNLVDQRQDVAGPMHQRILVELAKRNLKPGAP